MWRHFILSNFELVPHLNLVFKLLTIVELEISLASFQKLINLCVLHSLYLVQLLWQRNHLMAVPGTALKFSLFDLFIKLVILFGRRIRYRRNIR